MTTPTPNNTDAVVLNDAIKPTTTRPMDLFDIEADEIPNNKKKRKSAVKSNTYADFMSQLSELSSKRKEWEEGAFKTSNEQLYRILAQCLNIFQQMRGRYKHQATQRKKLTAALKEAGLTCNEGTPLATKIVRYVFRTDRKRSYVYSRIIMSADENKQDSLSLPNWINENGGIEEIRRKSKDGLSPSDFNKAYKDLAEERLYAAKDLVAPFKVVKELEASDGNNTHFAIALLRQNSDGTSSIVYGSNTASLINLLLIEAGKKWTSKKAIIDKENDRRKRQKERSVILKAAA